ncbi:MAG: diadenylate cyclase CdaA [Anaerolineae bacterium]|nr:diadenylate cyclase CdaA [Anaerolineae bacterium]
MNAFQSLYDQVAFFFSTLTWFGLVDLLLVATTFYLLLTLVRRSSAAYLLREVLVLSLVLFVVVTLLPLPVFGWLVRAVLVATLVAIPIIFQVQLRHFIERAGRAIGISQVARQSVADSVLPELVHAIEHMSASKTGALIVLEGTDSLEQVIESGVSSGGRVTSELLESIFHPGTPLHDGAVIIRTDRIVAAGCVLPLSQQILDSKKRLGTRHRAGVGLSETCDALVIVVSEETGYIALAQTGLLQRPVSSARLRDRLQDYYAPSSSIRTFSLWELASQAGRQFRYAALHSNPHQFMSSLGLLVMSLLLALVVWSFVIEQINPLQRVRVENISLRVENIPPETALIPSPPASIAAIIQTSEDALPTLSPRTFQAVVSLEQATPGLLRLPLQVTSSAEQVRVLSTDPPTLDLELAPIISRTLPVMIEVPSDQSLSAAYELVSSPLALPEQVQVIGPAPLVNTVSTIMSTISLATASGPLREFRPLQILDEQGREVIGVIAQPSQVQINVPIRHRLNARDANVRAITTGTPPPGFWLSGLSVTPSSITLQGRPDHLSEIGNIVDTLPVDISQAEGMLTIHTPLDLPAEIKAVDSEGRSVEAVIVVADVEARDGDLAITRQVELVRTTPGLTITINPPEVDLLLSGPLPVLAEIEANPSLIQVSIDSTDLGRAQSTDVTPTIIAPAGIEAQLAPSSVVVTVE